MDSASYHPCGGLFVFTTFISKLFNKNNMQNESGQVKRKRWFLRWWMFPVYFIVFMIFLVLVAGSSAPSTTTTTAQAPAPAVPEVAKPAIVVSAVRLYGDYKENEIAADAKYKGNVVKVSGIVNSIGKDILSTPYVTLAADQYGFSTVQCMFSRQDEPVLAQVSKGSSITLQGTVSGYTILTPIINGCQIVK